MTEFNLQLCKEVFTLNARTFYKYLNIVMFLDPKFTKLYNLKCINI